MTVTLHSTGARYDGPTVSVSLEVVNTYELYETVTTRLRIGLIPAPPTLDEDADAYHEWADEHILCFTGVGHTDGDSWYDVTITECPEQVLLVGRTFEWGY